MVYYRQAQDAKEAYRMTDEKRLQAIENRLAYAIGALRSELMIAIDNQDLIRVDSIKTIIFLCESIANKDNELILNIICNWV